MPRFSVVFTLIIFRKDYPGNVFWAPLKTVFIWRKKSARFWSPNRPLFFGRTGEPFFPCEKKGSRILPNYKTST
ncbi:MAG: hypothetical protein A2007_02625 [Verrucomicrobia bacterium GWC2_42_7]|nr:MAG: hypothetical protein A2007_02625 [Verrucomicrobia bacterium GWC2_42_7]